VATILLLSTADTELLAARSSGADYRTANPSRLSLSAVAGDRAGDPGGAARLTALADGADLVVLRLLGGRQAWPEGVAALRAAAGRAGW
jgi:cobaltochelatase CobN